MGCYFISNIKLLDESVYKKYLNTCDEIFTKYKGTYVAVDNAPIVLEGKYDYSRTIVIKFETEHDFNEWYYSEDYQQIVRYKLGGAQWTQY